MKIFSYFISFLLIQTFGFGQGENDNLKMLNTYSGNIYMGDNLLPEGTVYLIGNEKTVYNTEDETGVLSGVFQFDDLKQGNYTLYVIPEQDYDFFYFPKYIPTYSGNSYNWKNSQQNQYNGGAATKDIYLISYTEPFYGHCKISGKIKYHNGYRGGKDIPISIVLLNNDRDPMDFRIADETDGTFLFEYLPDGTYYIHPEIPGINTEELQVIVMSSKGTQSVNFLIENNSIRPEEIEDETLKPLITKNSLKVFLDSEVESSIICDLTDMSGRSIYKNIYSTEDIYINTSGMNVGIYLLRVRTFDNLLLKTTKVYINNY